MKSSTYIFILLICAGIFYLFFIGYLQPSDIPFYDKIHVPADTNTEEYHELTAILEENNLTIIDFAESNPVLVRFSSQSLDLLGETFLVAKKTYDLYNKSVRVEGYYLSNPVIALTSSDPYDDNLIGLEDIRTDEYMIETDMGIFDILLNDITLTDDTAILNVRYFGLEEELFNDYLAMCFVMTQDKPSLKKITIQYENAQSCFSFTTATEQVLKFYNDEITMDDFLGMLESTGCDKNTLDNGVDVAVDEPGTDEPDEIATATACPEGEELDRLFAESSAEVESLMSQGQGDTPEAQAAYQTMKFYRECYETT